MSEFWLMFYTAKAPLTMKIILFVLPVLLFIQFFSVVAVKIHRYSLHRFLQMAISLVMGVWLIFFELDVRIIGWRSYAQHSPFYDSWLFPALMLHVCFAIPFVLMWFSTLYGALKNFKKSAMSPKYSMMHKRMGTGSLLAFLGTAVSGVLFYWLAFVAV